MTRTERRALTVQSAGDSVLVMNGSCGVFFYLWLWGSVLQNGRPRSWGTAACWTDPGTGRPGIAQCRSSQTLDPEPLWEHKNKEAVNYGSNRPLQHVLCGCSSSSPLTSGFSFSLQVQFLCLCPRWDQTWGWSTPYWGPAGGKDTLLVYTGGAAALPAHPGLVLYVSGSTGGLLLTALPDSDYKLPGRYHSVTSLLQRIILAAILLHKSNNGRVTNKWQIWFISDEKSWWSSCGLLPGTKTKLWFHGGGGPFYACVNDYLHPCVVSVASFSPTSSPLFYAPCKTVTHARTHIVIHMIHMSVL